MLAKLKALWSLISRALNSKIGSYVFMVIGCVGTCMCAHSAGEESMLDKIFSSDEFSITNPGGETRAYKRCVTEKPKE